MLPSHLLMLTLPGLPTDYVPWLFACAIVVLGLIVYGWRDLLRLSPSRIWAISGVCFREAIRRRTLWVTPLAIIGVIVVCQLSSPGDPQNAIRQATKFCLFASGLLVTVVAILLACTNLPREIENRVIYTIVTKPTTRLEIVLGKVVGFARVSAAILLIMGVFTYGYLKTRTWTEMAQVHRQLATLPADSPARPTLAYYSQAGFLTTKSLEQTGDLQIYGRPPEGPVRWMRGGAGQYFLVPFELTTEQKDQLTTFADADRPVLLMTTLRVQQHKPNEEERKLIKQMGLDKPQTPVDMGRVPLGPELPSTQPATAPATAPTTLPEEVPLPPPQVSIRLLDPERRSIPGTFDANNGVLTKLQAPAKPEDSWYAPTELKPNIIRQLVAQPKGFYVYVSGRTPVTDFGAEQEPVILFIPGGESGIKIHPAPDKKNPNVPAPPEFYSFPARHGMRLQGTADGHGAVAVYRFRNLRLDRPDNNNAVLQLQLDFEKTADQVDDQGGGYARVSVETINRKTGKSSGPKLVTPETSGTIFLDIPYENVEGGDFDVLLQSLTAGQLLGVAEDSVSLVTADQAFVVNLAKSLLILWMLSLLVVIIAVFCSTFLSWPIAIVCTLVILLGHWGVEQLGDALKPGVGHSIVNEFRIEQPGGTEVVSRAVENLASMLRVTSRFLPDVSRFPVTEDIERGVSIPMRSMVGAIGVLLCFGLPLLVFSYIILRKKEVAP